MQLRPRFATFRPQAEKLRLLRPRGSLIVRRGGRSRFEVGGMWSIKGSCEFSVLLPVRLVAKAFRRNERRDEVSAPLYVVVHVGECV